MSRTARLVGLLLLGLSACSAQRAAPTTPPAASGGPTSTPFVYPGIKEPPTVPAAEANLTDDEEVIGVVIKGKPRAYRLAPFAGMLHHVVNDVVNKAAVTVTYCDRTDCIRTFTADGDRPLPVMLGGYNGGLLLRVGDDFFLQDTGKSIHSGKSIPYTALPHKRATWGEWKKAHPDTDVYLGPERKRPDDSPLEKS